MADFWAAAGVTATVIFGIVAAYATWRVANPKRELHWSVPATTPLLSEKHPDVEIRHGDDILNEPHLMELRLEVRGRRDISNADFNNNAPIVFNIGCPILSARMEAAEPNAAPSWIALAEEGILQVGPCLIKGRSVTSFFFMIDVRDGGSSTRPVLVTSPLINIKILNRTSKSNSERSWVALTPIYVVLWFGFLWLLTSFIGELLPGGVAVLVTGATFVTALALGLYRTR